ncbi:hypothetical protein [Pseudoalteromonas ulvae]|uniref:Polysaccharide polymerase n=1 Tax=Pseudoalteromonas ulvae TaxID=107327 RepID=A0A244CTE7_PSEDV|nr:hypothetical protein [Pseudoalteromonas ulvae]OUL58868.1 hypothetical protein B1199_00865 [Pseudoalteromonas ulvae]
MVNNISLKTLFIFSCFLLALDSLLKIPIFGFYMQAGVFVILVTFSLYMINNFHSVVKIKLDHGVTLIAVYLLVSSTQALDFSIYLKMMVYFIVPLVIYYFYFLVDLTVYELKILSRNVLLLLIITGFFEYIIKNYFGVQLEFKDMSSDYYFDNGDLANRLRGMFLEPNWYGLVMFSWLYVYIRATPNITSSTLLFFVFSIFCLYLSGNRLILAFIFFLFLAFLFKKIIIKIDKIIIPFSVLFFSVIFFVMALNFNFEADRSLIARFYTAKNVYLEMLESNSFNLLFGYGFSNWGFYSNFLEFSWSNYLFEQDLTRRDNAEIYVVLFELGLVGSLVFFYDAILLSRKKGDVLDKLFFSFIFVAAMFYPIYSFITYLIPVIIVRYRIFKEVTWA